MKISFYTSVIMSIILASALAITACGQKKDDGISTVVDARARTSGDPSVQAADPRGFVAGGTNVSAFVSGLGSLNSYDYEANVKNFLKSTWDIRPNENGEEVIGSIDPVNGSYLSAYIEMGVNGKINLATSKIKIWVLDSYYYNGIDGKKVAPFYVEINSAVSGSFSANQFTVKFKDSYQEITLSGSWDATYTKGSVSFANLKDALNEPLKSANPMGYYIIKNCAIMNCSK